MIFRPLRMRLSVVTLITITYLLAYLTISAISMTV